MTTMAIDPGETTGVAVLLKDSIIQGHEVATYAEMVALIENYRPSTIVIENYIVRRGRASNYHPPIRMIGVVEYTCQMFGIRLIIQSPSILTHMLKRVPDEVKSPHIRSAAAHLIYYLKLREVFFIKV